MEQRWVNPRRYLEALIMRVNNCNFGIETTRKLIDIIKIQWRISCILCDGFGHQSLKCSTKRKIKRMLKRIGAEYLWEDIDSNLARIHMTQGRR